MKVAFFCSVLLLAAHCGKSTTVRSELASSLAAKLAQSSDRLAVAAIGSKGPLKCSSNDRVKSTVSSSSKCEEQCENESSFKCGYFSYNSDTNVCLVTSTCSLTMSSSSSWTNYMVMWKPTAFPTRAPITPSPTASPTPFPTASPTSPTTASPTTGSPTASPTYGAVNFNSFKSCTFMETTRYCREGTEYSASTLTECKALCLEPDCMYIGYNAVDEKCRVGSECLHWDSDSNSDDWANYFKTGSTPRYRRQGGKMRCSDSYKLALVSNVADREDCGSECSSRSGCKFFSFNYVTNKCHLASGCSSLVSDDSSWIIYTIISSSNH